MLNDASAIRTLRGRVGQNDRRSWCGQPSDRGRLKNRTEQYSTILPSTQPDVIRSTEAFALHSATTQYHYAPGATRDKLWAVERTGISG